MFCPECGLKIPDNANFCTYCGKIIDSSIGPQDQPGQPTREDPAYTRPLSSPPPRQSQPPRQSTSGQLAIASIIIFIIGILLIYFGATTLYSTAGITMLVIGVIMVLCLIGAVTRGNACLCLACSNCGDCDCDC
jgi:uncharacterized membrane protein YvbJ